MNTQFSMGDIEAELINIYSELDLIINKAISKRDLINKIHALTAKNADPELSKLAEFLDNMNQ